MPLNRRDRELAKEIARQIRNPPAPAPKLESLSGRAAAIGGIIFIGPALWLLSSGSHWLFWGSLLFLGSVMPLLHLEGRKEFSEKPNQITIAFGFAYTAIFGLLAMLLIGSACSVVGYYSALMAFVMISTTLGQKRNRR